MLTSFDKCEFLSIIFIQSVWSGSLQSSFKVFTTILSSPSFQVQAEFIKSGRSIFSITFSHGTLQKRANLFLYVAVYVVLGAEDYNIRPYADAEQFFYRVLRGLCFKLHRCPEEGTNVT